MPEPSTPTSTPASAANALKIALSWAFVGIPALWGVGQVVEKTLALFR